MLNFFICFFASLFCIRVWFEPLLHPLHCPLAHTSSDNFASIVSAVEEGRSIFANMQSFIYFLVSCNIGELAIILTASILGLPEPLTTIQVFVLLAIYDHFLFLDVCLETHSTINYFEYIFHIITVVVGEFGY
jgi:hypothetical protein